MTIIKNLNDEPYVIALTNTWGQRIDLTLDDIKKLIKELPNIEKELDK